MDYPSNKDCTWLISVGSGKQIALMFTTFDVKRGSSTQDCQEDFVDVRNGLTDIARQIGGKYCNGNKPVLITTPRNIVRIHFHSGGTAISVSYKGFQIHYITVTPGTTYNKILIIILYIPLADAHEMMHSTVQWKTPCKKE